MGKNFVILKEGENGSREGLGSRPRIDNANHVSNHVFQAADVLASLGLANSAYLTFLTFVLSMVM